MSNSAQMTKQQNYLYNAQHLYMQSQVAYKKRAMK